LSEAGAVTLGKSEAEAMATQFEVPLDGSFAMHLRRSELQAVADGLGQFDASEYANLITLVEALRRMRVIDRAPLWELAMRRFGRLKPVERAAGEIGMDTIHARALIAHVSRLLAEVPPPEHASTL
jgi:hypothetical protein